MGRDCFGPGPGRRSLCRVRRELGLSSRNTGGRVSEYTKIRSEVSGKFSENRLRATGYRLFGEFGLADLVGGGGVEVAVAGGFLEAEVRVEEEGGAGVA